MPSFFTREDPGLDRRHGRMEAQHDPGLALDLLLPVRVHQQRQVTRSAPAEVSTM